ncbi:MAG: toxin-antitoxin system YwqK family antitoxin [Flavobacteriaceae bacterium]
MKKFLVVLFVSMISSGFGQNAYDAQGERHGSWSKNYEDGSIRYKGAFDHGREVGIFEFFTEGHAEQPSLVKVFKEDGSALCTYYDEKGLKSSEGLMQGKDKIGAWVYYKNGIVISKEFYKNGLLEGEAQVIHENGTIVQRTNYQKGKKNGGFLRYNKYGILLSSFVYVNDVLQGPVAVYNDQGVLMEKGFYFNDLKSGHWEFYDENGVVKTKDFN